VTDQRRSLKYKPRLWFYCWLVWLVTLGAGTRVWINGGMMTGSMKPKICFTAIWWS